MDNSQQLLSQPGRTSHVLLKDGELDRRVAIYTADSALEQEKNRLWQHCSDLILDAAAEVWGALFRSPEGRNIPPEHHESWTLRAVETTRIKFEAPMDRQWVAEAARPARYLAEASISSPVLVQTIGDLTDAISFRILRRFGHDQDKLRAFFPVLHRLSYYEMEILLSEITELEKQKAADERGKVGEVFRNDLVQRLDVMLDESAELRRETEATSTAARMTLSRASEVAMAAHQSSQSMLDAARTAAGLVESIALVEREIEGTSNVFSEAAAQSTEAVEQVERLAEEVQSIESILGFIRDIAGQTNLLALNATIEAARAGDAGRGFAVVAQEVKSLASQTARATDDIAGKIAAIQAATNQAVNANGAISQTIRQAEQSARNIRGVVEKQNLTVTRITASVDETARTADSISGTIAAIRSDTERMTDNVSRLEAGFRSVDLQLSEMKRHTAEFVTRVAG